MDDTFSSGVRRHIWWTLSTTPEFGDEAQVSSRRKLNVDLQVRKTRTGTADEVKAAAGRTFQAETKAAKGWNPRRRQRGRGGKKEGQMGDKRYIPLPKRLPVSGSVRERERAREPGRGKQSESEREKERDRERACVCGSVYASPAPPITSSGLLPPAGESDMKTAVDSGKEKEIKREKARDGERVREREREKKGKEGRESERRRTRKIRNRKRFMSAVRCCPWCYTRSTRDGCAFGF
ncbi:hypothetical protein RUM44_009882 [Polyplax serrata]|uniref:Uncharacterized protein n=1 Tax=Polyplax serrata TaxID=468196 RepID=A0ABR1ATX7_POLSC